MKVEERIKEVGQESLDSLSLTALAVCGVSRNINPVAAQLSLVARRVSSSTGCELLKMRALLFRNRSGWE